MKRASEIFIRNLEARRKALGLSLDDLARASKLSKTNIVRIRKPGTNLTLDTVERLAAALDTTVIMLLTDPETAQKKAEEVSSEISAIHSKLHLYERAMEAMTEQIDRLKKSADETQAHNEMFDKLRRDLGPYLKDLLDSWPQSEEWEKLSCLLLLTGERKYLDKLTTIGGPSAREKAQALMKALGRKIV